MYSSYHLQYHHYSVPANTDLPQPCSHGLLDRNDLPDLRTSRVHNVHFMKVDSWLSTVVPTLLTDTAAHTLHRRSCTSRFISRSGKLCVLIWAAVDYFGGRRLRYLYSASDDGLAHPQTPYVANN